MKAFIFSLQMEMHSIKFLLETETFQRGYFMNFVIYKLNNLQFLHNYEGKRPLHIENESIIVEDFGRITQRFRLLTAIHAPLVRH